MLRYRPIVKRPHNPQWSPQFDNQCARKSKWDEPHKTCGERGRKYLLNTAVAWKSQVPNNVTGLTGVVYLGVTDFGAYICRKQYYTFTVFNELSQLRGSYMPITEFCGISFQKLQWNFYIQKLTEEIMIVPAHTRTHAHTHSLTHTAALQEAARRDCEKEKGLSELPYTLNWVHSNTNLICQNPSCVSHRNNFRFT